MCSDVAHDNCCRACRARCVGPACTDLILGTATPKGLSDRSGDQLAHPTASTIRDHSTQQEHSITEHCLHILLKANNTFGLRVAEALNIMEHKPTLTCNETTVKLNTLQQLGTLQQLVFLGLFYFLCNFKLVLFHCKQYHFRMHLFCDLLSMKYYPG